MVLLTLQNSGKWNEQQRNWKVGDVVLLKEDTAEHNRWPVANSVKILVSAVDQSDNLIGYLERPVNKLVVLVDNEDGDN